MKKAWTSGLLALALSAGLLAGCGAQTAGQDQSGQTAQEAYAVQDGAVVDLGALLDDAVPLAEGPALSSVLVPVASGVVVEGNQYALIDYSNAQDGYVMVRWTGGGDARLKVLVKGPSGTTYQYNLRADGQYDTFPLSDGSGAYSVGVYQNTSGTQYATILAASVFANLTDEFAPFLRPNQYVTYTPGSAAVQKAAELCQGAGDNLAKVERIYRYVVSNTTYDKDKAQTVTSGYLPDVDQTLASGKGICFDYAALMAAMLRSQGVPVKLVVGYADGAYHAWISVFSEQQGWIEGKVYFDGAQWKLMDPTFASTGRESDAIMQYIGDGSHYSAKYLY